MFWWRGYSAEIWSLSVWSPPPFSFINQYLLGIAFRADSPPLHSDSSAVFSSWDKSSLILLHANNDTSLERIFIFLSFLHTIESSLSFFFFFFYPIVRLAAWTSLSPGLVWFSGGACGHERAFSSTSTRTDSTILHVCFLHNDTHLLTWARWGTSRLRRSRLRLWIRARLRW